MSKDVERGMLWIGNSEQHDGGRRRELSEERPRAQGSRKRHVDERR
jgi:hypothetical protein